MSDTQRRFQVHWGEPNKGHPRNSYVVLDTLEMKEVLITAVRSEAENMANQLNEESA